MSYVICTFILEKNLTKPTSFAYRVSLNKHKQVHTRGKQYPLYSVLEEFRIHSLLAHMESIVQS